MEPEPLHDEKRISGQTGRHFCFVFRFASRAATAFKARARRSSAVILAAAFFDAFCALAIRCSGVSAAADIFPPLLPCFRKNSATSGGSLFLGMGFSALAI